MNFVDEVTLEVQAGDGGNGCIAFRREKFVPRGGPSGGDGGKGGDVVLVADEGLGTLIDLRYAPLVKGGRGRHGMGKDMYGRAGEEKRLRVPVGTQVFDDGTGELLGDLTVDGQELVAAKGGKGGRGNMHFATPTNRAPRRAEPGEPGEHRVLRLELKLLADVGLVGFPNAGKSTLISRVSAARPKIADYPFTTLVPNLGVVRAGEYGSFVIADLPGLIEGAAEGVGMGTQFLKHVERCRLLVFLLDTTPGFEPQPERAYNVLEKELAAHDPGLATRERVVVLSKIDTGAAEEELRRLEKHFEKKNLPVHAVSSVTGAGIDRLVRALAARLSDLRAADEIREAEHSS